MTGKRKAVVSSDGGGEIESAANHSSLSLSIHPKPPKCNTRDVSNLLDQALERWERHHDLALYHAAQAQKHRAILHELQRFIIYRQPLKTEGVEK